MSDLVLYEKMGIEDDNNLIISTVKEIRYCRPIQEIHNLLYTLQVYRIYSCFEQLT